jgi:hypothetical protein
VTEFDKQVRDLEEEVYRLRCTVIDLAPGEFHALLQASGRPMESWKDFHTWRDDVANAIAEATDPKPPSSVWWKGAPCPLCHGHPIGFHRAGFKLPEGLRRHLAGDKKAQHCAVTEAAFSLVLDRYSHQFEKRREAEREEKRLRLRAGPKVLIDPARAPLTLFEDEWFGSLRNPDELATVEERLREIGFAVEKNDNVFTYRLMHGTEFMVLANPRPSGKVQFHLFKRTGKQGWKEMDAATPNNFFLQDSWREWPAKFRTRLLERLERQPKLKKREPRSSKPRA